MQKYLAKLATMDHAALQRELEDLRAKQTLLEVVLSCAAPSWEKTEEFEGNGVRAYAKVSNNDLGYGLLRFGYSLITENWTMGSTIRVLFQGKEYKATIPPSSQIGRINGMTKLYRENPIIRAGTKMVGEMNVRGDTLLLTLEI